MTRASDPTRTRLISTAERLFAEQGMSVSDRTIGAAAKQANKSVVAYHFGSRDELVLAIARHHDADVDARRKQMMVELGERGALADWLRCIVIPITDHLASLTAPTYARFLVGCMADIRLRQLVFEDAAAQTSTQRLFAQVNARLPSLPPEVFEARGFMTQHLIVNICADYERSLQSKTRSPYRTWQDVCGAIVDALVGLWRADSHSMRAAVAKSSRGKRGARALRSP